MLVDVALIGEKKNKKSIKGKSSNNLLILSGKER